MCLKFQLVAVLMFVCMMTTGCDRAAKAPEPPSEPPRVAYSTLPRERRMELANAMAAALMEFDDLYGCITATVDESSENLAVVVTAGAKTRRESVGQALGVALANFEFRAPGVRYVSTGDRTWKVILPDDMQVAAEGKFDFRLP